LKATIDWVMGGKTVLKERKEYDEKELLRLLDEKLKR